MDLQKLRSADLRRFVDGMIGFDVIQTKKYVSICRMNLRDAAGLQAQAPRAATTRGYACGCLVRACAWQLRKLRVQMLSESERFGCSCERRIVIIPREST